MSATSWRDQIARDAIGKVFGPGSILVNTEMKNPPKIVVQVKAEHRKHLDPAQIIWQHPVPGSPLGNDEYFEEMQSKEIRSGRGKATHDYIRADGKVLRSALQQAARDALSSLEHPRALLVAHRARAIFPVLLDEEEIRKAAEGDWKALETLWRLGCDSPHKGWTRWTQQWEEKPPRTRSGKSLEKGSEGFDSTDGRESLEEKPCIPSARYIWHRQPGQRHPTLGCRIHTPRSQQRIGFPADLVRWEPGFWRQRYLCRIESIPKAEEISEAEAKKLHQRLREENRKDVRALQAAHRANRANRTNQGHQKSASRTEEIEDGMTAIRIQLLIGLAKLADREAMETCRHRVRIYT